MLAPKIIYEDKEILVINKPSGLVVNRAESVKGKTLQDWTEKEFRIKNLESRINGKSDFAKRSGIVHRLDKDTSGVMVIARNPKAFENLQSQFKQRKVRKIYLALVHSKVEPRVGDIRMPLSRQPKQRKKFGVRLGGKMSETKYQLLKVYDQYSLLQLKPKTGRTHQLRVHLSHIGYPIVADPIYLGQKRLKQDQTWCSRLFLHARNLSFIHPQTKKRLVFKATLAKDLRLSFEKHFKVKIQL